MRPGPAVPVVRLVRLARRWLARRQQVGGQGRIVADPGAPLPSALDRADEFRQVDAVSCGASSLVFSRMLHDATYGSWVLDDHARWGSEVRAMHRRVSGLHDHTGLRQWPWPRALGTSPWGAARQMGGGQQRSGHGPRYGWRTLDPDQLDAEFDRIATAVLAGHTVPLYVGNAVRPAHVVLVVSSEPEAFRVYEPSAGRIVRVRREAFTSGEMRLGGWSVPWFAVLPR